MEKIIRHKFDLLQKYVKFNKLEEVVLWVVFFIVPLIVFGYPAYKILF